MQGRTDQTPYTMSVIGPWRLELNGREIDIPSRKARALLTYLALTQSARHNRESIAALLWEESEAPQARASLRQVLVAMNKALGPSAPTLLIPQSEELGLLPGALRCDVDLLLESTCPGPGLEQAARIITTLPRLLLSDLGISGEAIETWRRETLGRVVGDVRQRLAHIFEDTRVSREMRQRAAEAAFSLDEFDESAARAIMACHVESGNSAAALRFYGELHARLEAELDAEPSIETQRMAVQIKQIDFATDTTPTRPAQVMQSPIVAVLPFEFLGDTLVPDYIPLGLLDQITCQLASFPVPAVISSNTTRRYLNRSPANSDLRRELAASYVVTGSVLHQGGKAALTVQLVDSLSDLVVWAGNFQCSISALFDIRSKIADSIVHAIVPSVNLAELRRAESGPTESLEPYHLVLQAKELILRLDRAVFDQAGKLLAQATARDPQFAPAHALAAEWYALRHWQGWSANPDEDRTAIENHASRAISLSPGNGRAISLLGHCRMLFERRYDEALRLFDTALEHMPNDSETLVWTVPTLAFSSRETEAIENGNKANSLSPLDPFKFRNEHFLGIAHYVSGNFDLAAEYGLSCHRRAPDYASNLRTTIAALQALDRKADLAPLVDHHRKLLPDFSVAALMERHGLRRPADRERFAGLLVAAGLQH